MSYLFALILLLAPLYVWRFSIGGLPTNFLMLASFGVIAIGLVGLGKDFWSKLKASVLGVGKPLLIGIGLIGLASLISLFVFGFSAEKLAQWVVLYAQPLGIFFLVRHYAGLDERVGEYIKIAGYVLVGAAGFLAVVQYFTLLTLPSDWWGNANEPKRAIAFFSHANAYGLFITPLLAWLLPDVVKKFWSFGGGERMADQNKHKLIYAFLWVLGAVGILLTLSRGAWLGLAVAATAFVIVSANKKILLTFIIAAVVAVGVIAAVPNWRYRLIMPFHGEKSTNARFSLWDTGVKMVVDSPIVGKGINGFNYSWEEYNTNPNLDHYNFPHNILLNFWVDLGLLGVIGFAIVFLHTLWQGIKNRHKTLAVGAALFVLAMIAHGLIDIPYLKNDLALVFWLVLALSSAQQS